jgi:hypothetical protein
MRRDTFGKQKACLVLDKLLEDCPYSKVVGRTINRYKSECQSLIEISDKTLAESVLSKLQSVWIGYINDKPWNDEIKHYTQNVMRGIFREAIKDIRLSKN